MNFTERVSTILDNLNKSKKIIAFSNETSKKWGISVRRIQKLCAENRIDGVVRFSRVWAIPKDAQKPITMVGNTAINLYSQRKRRTTIPLEDAEYCITTEPISVAEDLDHLARAVLKLPVIYKDVLTLKYVQEFSNEEIAKMLNISEATVRKRLERAKRRLEEILKREDSTYAE